MVIELRRVAKHLDNFQFINKIQQDATIYQNFIIPCLYESQHVSDDTPPIIRSLKLHWQLVATVEELELVLVCCGWRTPQDTHVTEFILSDDCSTCFGYHCHPSSGAQNNCNYSI